MCFTLLHLMNRLLFQVGFHRGIFKVMSTWPCTSMVATSLPSMTRQMQAAAAEGMRFAKECSNG